MNDGNYEASGATDEERLRIATRAAQIGIWEWHVPSGEMVYSPIARAICGFDAESPVTIGRVRAITHPDDHARTSAAARRALDPELREDTVYRYRIRREDDGAERWVEAHGEAVFGAQDGRTVALRYVGTMRDITAEKAREDEVYASEARIRLAIDTGQMAVWEVDQDTGRVLGSPALNRLCGFPEDSEPTLADFRTRYAPGEMERLQKLGEEIRAAGGDRVQTELRQIWPDGSEHWLLMRAQAAPPELGNRVLGVLIDITESKRNEQRLRLLTSELRHRLKNLVSVVRVIVMRSMAGGDLPAARRAVDERLRAIGTAIEFALADEAEATPLAALMEALLAPHLEDGRQSIVFAGTDEKVRGQTITLLALAIHELGTNAAKYGALSAPGGQVDIRWRREGGRLVIDWTESGGPPVATPETEGFGTTLLRRGLFLPPDELVLDYRPEGVTCRMRLAALA